VTNEEAKDRANQEAIMWTGVTTIEPIYTATKTWWGGGGGEGERTRRETRSGAYGTQIDQRDAQGARQQETETERKLWRLMLKVEERIEERIAERKNRRIRDGYRERDREPTTAEGGWVGLLGHGHDERGSRWADKRVRSFVDKTLIR
jgi:hypothetical protein